MSGPKISELEAIRAKQLRDIARNKKELELIIKKWESEFKRQGHQYADELDNALKAINEVDRLRRENKLEESLNKCLSYQAFYNGEFHELQHKWVKAKEVEIKRARRAQNLSAYMINELEVIGHVPPDILRDAAKGSIKDLYSSDELEEAISKASIQLEEHDKRQMADANDSAVQEYAKFFMDEDNCNRSLSEWLKTQEETTGRFTDLHAKLDKILSELEIWCPKESLIGFKQRANTIHSTLESDQRYMLLNSLVLEVSDLKNNLEEEKVVKESLEKSLANLDLLNGEDAKRWKDNINKSLEGFNLNAAKKLIAKFEVWVALEEENQDAEVRRNAVLEALGQLGYEVREGMLSALIIDGKIVLQKPMKKDYGLEVTVPKKGKTLSTRIVAFRSRSTSHNKVKDKEMEEEWCSDYAQFKSFLDESGIGHNFRKVHKPGEVDMKVIKRELDESRGRVSDNLKSREQSN
jgi:hypothetical protein